MSSKRSKQSVTLISKQPPGWIKQAEQWGIDAKLMTPENIHKLVQSKIHIQTSQTSQNQTTKSISNSVKSFSEVLPANLKPNNNNHNNQKRCCKCLGKVEEETVQSRSADEGSTVNYHCAKCGKTTLYNFSGALLDDDEPEEVYQIQ